MSKTEQQTQTIKASRIIEAIKKGELKLEYEVDNNIEFFNDNGYLAASGWVAETWDLYIDDKCVQRYIDSWGQQFDVYYTPYEIEIIYDDDAIKWREYYEDIGWSFKEYYAHEENVKHTLREFCLNMLENECRIYWQRSHNCWDVGYIISKTKTDNRTEETINEFVDYFVNWTEDFGDWTFKFGDCRIEDQI